MNTPQDPIQFLQERGFIHQSTELEGLREHLQQGCATIYLGFDATADSLHVGHLQGLMVMRWLQRFGHRPILLIGGATTRIGDPGFRDESRPMLSEAQIQHNIAGICQTLARLVQLGQADNAGLMEDNADWLDGMGYLQFLNQVGRHFSINRLLTFDAVRQRLDREHSLSFQEFGYTLLQAHDFTELAKRLGCSVQLGGADQWANIINGIELARRQDGRQLFGLTMPLLTTSDGRKMGKSAQGAIWLNPQRLSPFDFWQFWRNCDDRDVGRFLALFTELPLAEIANLAQAEGMQLNAAKVRLASAVTALVHGEQAAQLAEATAKGLFAVGDELQGLTTLSVPRSRLAAGYSLTELLEQHDLQPSRGATRRLAAGGGLRLDGETVADADLALPADGDGWLLSLGKKRHYCIQLEG